MFSPISHWFQLFYFITRSIPVKVNDIFCNVVFLLYSQFITRSMSVLMFITCQLCYWYLEFGPNASFIGICHNFSNFQISNWSYHHICSLLVMLNTGNVKCHSRIINWIHSFNRIPLSLYILGSMHVTAKIVYVYNVLIVLPLKKGKWTN